MAGDQICGREATERRDQILQLVNHVDSTLPSPKKTGTTPSADGASPAGPSSTAAAPPNPPPSSQASKVRKDEEGQKDTHGEDAGDKKGKGVDRQGK